MTKEGVLCRYVAVGDGQDCCDGTLPIDMCTTSVDYWHMVSLL